MTRIELKLGEWRQLASGVACVIPAEMGQEEEGHAVYVVTPAGSTPDPSKELDASIMAIISLGCIKKSCPFQNNCHAQVEVATVETTVKQSDSLDPRDSGSPTSADIALDSLHRYRVICDSDCPNDIPSSTSQRETVEVVV